MEINTNIKSGEVKIADSTQQQPVVKEPDIITRVSQIEEKKEDPKPTGEVKEPEFDFKEIEELRKKDPEAAAWAEKSYKSFQRGYNQKFQELAELRKSLEAQRSSPVETPWTPERLQQEMNKPDFVNAAQSVIKLQNPAGSGLTEDEWSTLSEGEKKKLSQMEQELTLLKQQSIYSQMRQQDEQLKAKYADYDPKAIDTITADMLAGRVQTTREHIYKAMKYDDAVRKAYELGKQDRKLENEEKLNSMSAAGTNAVNNEEVPSPEPGETSKNYFLRLATRNLQKAAAGQIKK